MNLISSQIIQNQLKKPGSNKKYFNSAQRNYINFVSKSIELNKIKSEDISFKPNNNNLLRSSMIFGEKQRKILRKIEWKAYIYFFQNIKKIKILFWL